MLRGIHNVFSQSIERLESACERLSQQPFNHVVKYSTISTGQLSTSQCLHLQPIDVLVLHGSSVYPEGDIETLS